MLFVFVVLANSSDSLARTQTTLSRAGMFPDRTSVNWFLGIGITNYDSNAVWKDLRNARGDMEYIHSTLTTEYQFTPKHSILLVDSLATRENILDTLRFLALKVRDSDNLIIYFAGHGYQHPDTRIGFWIPCDGGRDATSLISCMDLKLNGIVNSSAMHIVLFVDACYGSTIFDDRKSKPAPTVASIADRGDSAVVINVNVTQIPGFTPDEQVKWSMYHEIQQIPSREAYSSGRLKPVTDGRDDHSPFALHIYEFLKDRQTPFTVLELAADVNAKVYQDTEQAPRYGHLKLEGDEGGEFVFWRREY